MGRRRLLQFRRCMYDSYSLTCQAYMVLGTVSAAIVPLTAMLQFFDCPSQLLICLGVAGAVTAGSFALRASMKRCLVGRRPHPSTSVKYVKIYGDAAVSSALSQLRFAWAWQVRWELVH